MAVARSKKSTFISNFSLYNDPIYIRADQYLAECAVGNFYKQKLPPKFWNLEEYKEKFLFEVIIANKLLKKYPIEPIFKTVKECNLYSLCLLISKKDNFAKTKLENNIRLHIAEQQKIEKLSVEVNQIDVFEKPKQLPKNKNILNRLRDIESNGKKEE